MLDESDDDADGEDEETDVAMSPLEKAVARLAKVQSLLIKEQASGRNAARVKRRCRWGGRGTSCYGEDMRAGKRS